MRALPRSFYKRNNVVELSNELLGKFLFTKENGTVTGGMIIETEAYAGETDRACHAYGGKRTKRTEPMFHEGGKSYVYLCYGIHHLFNIVTNKEGIPDAVLIRAIYPVEGVNTIVKRRNKKAFYENITNGPGTVTQALNIRTDTHNSLSLKKKNDLWIADDNIQVSSNDIKKDKRVGIGYAGEDANLPYRFILNNLKF
ncbi:MAG: DNA-3-methyladenine glycosylase [Flavobacteriales bacterium]